VIINWSSLASKDLEDIVDYILESNPQAALAIYDRIKKKVEMLAEYPNIGRVGRVAGTRELIISGTSFIVPYRVQDKTIEILRVLHASRQWPESL